MNKLFKIGGVFILMYLSFLSGEQYTKLIHRVALIDEGRQEAIDDVNALLKSQAFSIKFRIGEHGTALVFPSPTRKSIYNKWANYYKIDGVVE